MNTATPQHGETAFAVSRETGWDLDDYASERGWAGVELGPVGVHRDSDALARSNFDVIYPEMCERFGEAVDSPRFGHWGVGWIDEIAWDAGRDDIREYVESWRAALENYPVADESHFSELEYDEAVEIIKLVSGGTITRDGISYEISELLPDDWSEQVFSAMFDVGVDTSPDGMRDEWIEDAMLALGFYVPEYPIVLLDA